MSRLLAKPEPEPEAPRNCNKSLGLWELPRYFQRRDVMEIRGPLGEVIMGRFPASDRALCHVEVIVRRRTSTVAFIFYSSSPFSNSVCSPESLGTLNVVWLVCCTDHGHVIRSHCPASHCRLSSDEDKVGRTAEPLSITLFPPACPTEPQRRGVASQNQSRQHGWPRRTGESS